MQNYSSLFALLFDFQLPEVCSYQAVTYTVTATDPNSRPVLHEENTVFYNDGARLTFTITGSQLDDDSVTSLQVSTTFDLVGVESQPAPLTALMTIGNRWLITNEYDHPGMLVVF